MTFVVDSNGVTTQAVPNRAVLTEWVEALESGKFEQASGVLRNDDGYCCLGVLCEIAVRHGVIESAVAVMDDDWMAEEDTPTGAYSYGDDDAFLPEAVQRWAFGDLDRANNPEIDYEGGTHAASDLNDQLELSFPEIAKAIRETFAL